MQVALVTTLGAFAVTELKILTSTRNKVTRSAIRPATNGNIM